MDTSQDNAREVRRRLDLAEQGKAACTVCGRTGDLKTMIAVMFRGNVMLATHPDCLGQDGFRVYRRGDDIAAQVAKPAARPSDLIVKPSDIRPGALAALKAVRPAVSRRNLGGE